VQSISIRPTGALGTTTFGALRNPLPDVGDKTLIDRQSECAAIEKKNGMYRLIEASWDVDAVGGAFDYYHAAFELDGRWNAEFFDEAGKSIWARGLEDTLEFEWELRPTADTVVLSNLLLEGAIQVTVSDVEFDDVPAGALCQTVEERAHGIPRHWKKWRIL